MRTALRDPYLDDGRAAGQARFTFTVIHIKVILRFAFATIGFAVPVHARSLMFDAFVQNGADGSMQAFDFAGV